MSNVCLTADTYFLNTTRDMYQEKLTFEDKSLSQEQ